MTPPRGAQERQPTPWRKTTALARMGGLGGCSLACYARMREVSHARDRGREDKPPRSGGICGSHAPSVALRNDAAAELELNLEIEQPPF